MRPKFWLPKIRRQIEVGAIEQIERFPPELQLRGAAERHVLASAKSTLA
jgi:hypothetical protein